GAKDVVGTRAVVVAAPHPRHLQLVEVLGVDLVERRVAGVAGIAPPIPPLTVLGAGLHAGGLAGRCRDRQRHGRPRRQACRGTPPDSREFRHRTLLELDLFLRGSIFTPRIASSLPGSSSSPAGKSFS